MTLYFTGAGVSSESGIPTFRGHDGYWVIGSKNYTPESMATRSMYTNDPENFLLWYYSRFASYINIKPNDVHYWLADKNLITQNIDGLDAKAGNKSYIPIHGRLDLMARFCPLGNAFEINETPWDRVDQNDLKTSLFDVFNIRNHCPEIHFSYKPFVLLFDEYYTEEYRISEAIERIQRADRIVFMGTSFSVGITKIALDTAIENNIPIEIVDPNPVRINYKNVTYHKTSASDYIQRHDA